MNRPDPPRWRTLLVLGRVSNLPTVWTDCLAGWWLAGGGYPERLPALFLGTSLLYIAGMFLNDALDEQFDRQRRPERPIPSGRISGAMVWRYGWLWLALGLAVLAFAGAAAAIYGVILAGFILLYDAVHKYVTASPWLMGLCRFWVYLIAGAAGGGNNGWNIVCGLALAVYVAGLSLVARRESTPGGGFRVPRWPFILLAAPVVAALLINTGPYLPPILWVGSVFGLWTAFSLRSLWEPVGANLGRIVTGLLAGITMVDWLSVAPDCPRGLSLLFPILLLVTRLAQRLIPAT